MKDIPDRSDPARRDPLIGKTVSHYKVLDRLGPQIKMPETR